jgi:hypothetical protein
MVLPSLVGMIRSKPIDRTVIRLFTFEFRPVNSQMKLTHHLTPPSSHSHTTLSITTITTCPHHNYITDEMAPPARTKVFANFDLLEDILLHLPLQDLLLTQGVCKQWQSMQQTSTRVRKALFLEPFHAQKVYYPSTSKPQWYLIPGRDELMQQGFLSEDDSDDLSYSTPDENIPGSGSSDGSDGSNGSGGSDLTICNVNMDKYRMRQAEKSKQQDFLGSSGLYGDDSVNPKIGIPKDPPADKMMPVARIASGPFMNPFAELFCKSNSPLS